MNYFVFFHLEITSLLNKEVSVFKKCVILLHYELLTTASNFYNFFDFIFKTDNYF